MPVWVVTLIIELIKMIIPIIIKVRNDPKPNKEAAKEVVTKLRGVIGEPPTTKGI